MLASDLGRRSDPPQKGFLGQPPGRIRTLHYVLVFCILQALLISFIVFVRHRSEHEYLIQTTAEQENIFLTARHSLREQAVLALDGMVKRLEILSLLQQAAQTEGKERDLLRQELYGRLYPAYAKLKDVNFRQIHFHLPDGTSFLRMHLPDDYGDQLAPVRKSVRAVIQGKAEVESFEIGRHQHAFRYVYPLFLAGEFLGTVEFGVPFAIFRHELRISPSAGEYRLIVKKEVVERLVVPSAQGSYEPSGLSDGFLVGREDEVSSQEHPRQVSEQQIRRIDAKLSGAIDRQLQGDAAFSRVLAVDGQDVLVHFLPVRDQEGELVAFLVSYRQDVAFAGFARGQLGHYLLGTVLILALLLLHRYFTVELLFRIRFQEHLIAAIPVPVFFEDAEGRFLDGNTAFGQLAMAEGGAGEGESSSADASGLHALLVQQGNLKDGEKQIVLPGKGDEGGARHLVLHKIGVGRDPGQGFSGYIGVVTDTTEQARAMEAARFKEERLTVLLRLDLLPESRMEPLLRFALEHAVLSTASEVGYLHFYDESTGEVTLTAWSGAVGEGCTNGGKGAHYSLARAGIWADSVRQRRPVIHNDYPSQPGRAGVPEGHFPISRHLSVPVILGGRVVGVVGVGNRKEPYSHRDAIALMEMMSEAWRIFQKKEAEAAQAETALRLDQIFNAAADGMWVVAQDFTILMVNDTLLRMMGEPRERVVGKKCHDIFFGELCQGSRCPLAQVLAGEERVEDEAEKENLLGQKFTCQITAVPFRDQGGRIIGVVENFRDISSRKQMEDELRQTRDTAEAANRSKSEFIANMSHEIRTPLNGILGLTTLTLHSELTEKQRQHLDLIKKSGERLLEILNQILDFSKIEAGRLELAPQSFLLRDMLGEIVEEFSLVTEEKGLFFCLEVSPEVPNQWHGDALRLRQVLSNLLNNAVKFTEHGGISLSVGVEEHRQDAGRYRLHFVVRDTGIGVDPAKENCIFDPFRQADGSMTRRYGGTGLGLSICRQLVEMMGGRIWHQRPDDGGASFHFTVLMSQDPGGVHFLSVTHPLPSPKQPLLLFHCCGECPIDVEALARIVPAQVVQGPPFPEASAFRDGGHPLIVLAAGRHNPELLGQLRETGGPGNAPVLLVDEEGITEGVEERAGAGGMVFATAAVSADEVLRDCLWVMARVRQEREEAAESSSPRRFRILLAEDDFVNQTVMMEIISMQGWDGILATNGGEAVEIAARESVDMVLMDVQMPVMDGFEATRLIREQEGERGGRVPIIALTAHAMKEDRQRCLDAGMDGYLAKPVRLDDLLATVGQFLRPAKAQDGGISTEAAPG
ncbi:MAG: GAF domain-containing protein [Thermodesulfobacteriota bacterium]